MERLGLLSLFSCLQTDLNGSKNSNSKNKNQKNFHAICSSVIASSEYNLAISPSDQNAFIVYYCRVHFGWWAKTIKFEKANYFYCYYHFPIPLRHSIFIFVKCSTWNLGFENGKKFCVWFACRMHIKPNQIRQCNTNCGRQGDFKCKRSEQFDWHWRKSWIEWQAKSQVERKTSNLIFACVFDTTQTSLFYCSLWQQIENEMKPENF